MSANNQQEQNGNKKGIIYSANQTPPATPLFFSSLQHTLLVVSLGMALPISVARSAGLDLSLSASLLAASLFAMGVTSILQTFPGKFLGTGYQSISVSDSAALAACIMAAEIGGVPLVLGMTIFSGVLKAIIGSFTFNFRKLFPPEVTGTMIFILGISTLPTGLKFFLGNSSPELFDPKHLAVAIATLLFMLSCSLFIKPLKPYTALVGIVFGFVLSAIVGIFDVSSLSAVTEQSLVSIPIYSDLSYSFDFSMLIPFLVITIAAVVDNIGDYSSTQSSNDKDWQKPNWKSIENGIRASGLGTALSGLIGGPMQSTATTNIGIASASGITSRKVAYLTGGMLIFVSFFPSLSGILSLIPAPVLGAVIMYSICYIMAGGFSALASRTLDDRRIFVIFLSIAFAVSTLIPNLYSFLPAKVAQIVVSPMVMGVGVLLFTTLLGKIGTKKKFNFTCGVSNQDVIDLNKEIHIICEEWCTDKDLQTRLKVGLNALCEGFYEEDKDTEMDFVITYDQLQVKLNIRVTNSRTVELPGANKDEDILSSSLLVAEMMVRNMFDKVTFTRQNDAIIIYLDADV